MTDRIALPANAAASHALICHPATPCAAVQSVRAGWRWHTGGGAPQLRLRYTLQGRLDALRLPGAQAPRFADGLWRHTCFEAFVGSPAGSAYHEFNFAPSGEWAAYGFSAERRRDAAADERLARCALAPVATHQGAALTLEVRLPLAALPATEPDASWPLGLTAVIETQDGALSYWALQHPSAQPDFHARAAWTARLEAPRLLNEIGAQRPPHQREQL